MDYALALGIASGSAVVANASSLVGFVMPLVVEYINQDVPSETERRLAAVVACFLSAVILHWSSIANGAPQDVVLFFGITFVESQALFKLYFRNSLARGIVQKIVGTKWVEEKDAAGEDLMQPTATIAPATVEAI